jgi:hypothetical protein
MSLVFRRPDLGLVAVAGWTALSSLLLLVRLGIAVYARTHGPLRSWLADDTGRSGNGSLAVRLFIHQVPTP